MIQPAQAQAQTKVQVPVQAAAAQLLLRRRARENLVEFGTYMRSTGSTDFQHPPAAHHRLIINRLQDLEAGRIQRLLILAPPGSAKSTYCSIQFPLWFLARHPTASILCVSNTQDLAANFNRRRRNLALTNQFTLLANTPLAEDLQGAEHFGTKMGGSIKAAGVGSAIVGTRSVLNVLDDPIRGLEEAMSAPTLAKQWDWYCHEYRTRLVPDGRELIVSTRWAKNDIAGRILATEPERWTVLRLPMLADRDDDPLGRALGESLWPEYFTPEHVAEAQTNPLLWSTQFQQTPLDESGSWVDNEHIVASYRDKLPKDLAFIISADLALTVGKGDYTVFMVCAVDSSRHIWIADLVREQVSPEVAVDRLLSLCAQYRPTEVLIDDDNASKVFRQLLFAVQRQTSTARIPLNMMPLRGQNKEIRAAAIRGLLMMDAVRIVKAPWNGMLHEEMLAFPAGDHDDCVDALSLVGRRFAVLGAPSGDDQPVKDPYAGFAARFDDKGNSFTTATLDDMFADREQIHSRRAGRI